MRKLLYYVILEGLNSKLVKGHSLLKLKGADNQKTIAFRTYKTS